MNTNNKFGLLLSSGEMKKVIGGSAKLTTGFHYKCFDLVAGTVAFEGCYSTPPTIECGWCKDGVTECSPVEDIPPYSCS